VGNGVGDACEQFCYAVVLSNVHGAGALSWKTSHEVNLGGFSAFTFDPRGNRVELASQGCENCITGGDFSYSNVSIPKHKSGKNVFIQMLDKDGHPLAAPDGVCGPAL